MSKAIKGGKSNAAEGSKKRTPHITPTTRQLAYLDELKTRLMLMRERQAIFMEQTAKMLTGISSVNMVGNSVIHEAAAGGALPVEEVNEDMAVESKSTSNIKQLIQRFEDLRQNSQQFTDLPDVPEELVNVDVRRILKGYEKLIEEGNIIQQSWLLLKNTTESCVRFAATSEFDTPEDQSEPTNPTESELGIAEVSDVAPKCSTHVIFPQHNAPSWLYPNTDEGLEDKDWDPYKPKKDKDFKDTAKNRGHARWGPFMRLIIRLLKPLHRTTQRSRKPPKACSLVLLATVPPKNENRSQACSSSQPHKMHK